MYVRFILGIDGCFRAIDIVRLNPVFHAAAAIPIGVFGVGGVGLASSSAGIIISFAAFAGKGSELRKACLVDVTRFEKLDAIEDFRGGNAVRLGEDSFGNGRNPWGALEKDIVDEIERRRNGDSLRGAGLRALGRERGFTSASKARDCLF